MERWMSLINKSADWPPNYHKTARIFPLIFCTFSFNEQADSKPAIIKLKQLMYISCHTAVAYVAVVVLIRIFFFRK